MGEFIFEVIAGWIVTFYFFAVSLPFVAMALDGPKPGGKYANKKDEKDANTMGALWIMFFIALLPLEVIALIFKHLGYYK